MDTAQIITNDPIKDPKDKPACTGTTINIAGRRSKFDFSNIDTDVLNPRQLTISSPGISPRALLDSPIMMDNSQLSPTTGTFPASDGSSIMEMMDSSYDFNSNWVVEDDPGFSVMENQVSSPFEVSQRDGGSTYQGLTSDESPLDFEFSEELSKEGPLTNGVVDSITDVKVTEKINLHQYSSRLGGTLSYATQSQQNCIQKAEVNMDQGERKETNNNVAAEGASKTSEDGYNWKKYGQKHVKGSEYPRSYYKCTHPSCIVKKKVERSHDGHITEIIYNGVHNHPNPQPSRRQTFPSDDDADRGQPEVKIEGDIVSRSSQTELKDVGSNCGLKKVSSASGLTEVFSDPSTNSHLKSAAGFESIAAPEVSSSLASHDDEDDVATQSISLDDGADDDELDSKRRKTETCLNGTNFTSRAVREPRVIVQIESEIDILDDGYRWRKYGQKVVKGNPNPRSYYKCTSPGCSVRKHVERASNNLKFVITTYEGKHNHEVPSARNGTHLNTTNSGANGQSALTLPRNNHALKPETQVEDITHHHRFDAKPEFNTDYLRTGFLGNFNNDVKFAYKMKYPHMPTFNPFALNSNSGAGHQVVVPDFPMPLPYPSPNLSLAGLDFNSNWKPYGPVQSFHPGQLMKENEMKFVRPKQEQKDDHPCLPIVDNSNATSSLYRQVMGKFPQ